MCTVPDKTSHLHWLYSCPVVARPTDGYAKFARPEKPWADTRVYVNHKGVRMYEFRNSPNGKWIGKCGVGGVLKRRRRRHRPPVGSAAVGLSL